MWPDVTCVSRLRRPGRLPTRPNMPGPMVNGLHGADLYEVKLSAFNGPLDLLLYLIKRDEIEICDIPIAHVTAQYLRYVKLMQLQDLEEAGQYLVMAATLMKIKSEMLLPSRDSEAEEEDPRSELVRRLMEYQQYRALSWALAEREAQQEQVFYRGAAPQAAGADRGIEEAPLSALVAAFEAAVAAMPKTSTWQVEVAEPSVEERMEFVLRTLEDRKRVSFARLIRGLSRPALVVTFAALLELVKSQQVRARQGRAFGDIWLYGPGT